jgi:hypothetical protein
MSLELFDGLALGSFVPRGHGLAVGGHRPLTQADTFIPQGVFIPQTRLNLVCGISFVCKNNHPIT